LTVPALATIAGGSFGFKNDISNNGSLTPDVNFTIGLQGQNVQLATGGLSSSFAAADFGLSTTDLTSDFMQVAWEIEYLGADQFEVTRFRVRNMETGFESSLNAGAVFTNVGDLFYTQGLALNGNAGFTGRLGNLDVEFNTPELVPLLSFAGIGYDDSFFDGNVAGDNGDDDNAIDTSKVPLLVGETATFANYSTFDHGITTLIIDVENLADADGLSADDFQFRTGNGDLAEDFTDFDAVTPVVSVRHGQGDGGSDRITLRFPQDSITNTWLQTTILATSTTGFTQPQTFYFGSIVGDTGNSATDAIVDTLDLGEIRENFSGFSNVDIDSPHDLNRDGRVDTLDLGVVRENFTGFVPVNLITAPDPDASRNIGAFIEQDGVVIIEGESGDLPRSHQPGNVRASLEKQAKGLWPGWRRKQ